MFPHMFFRSRRMPRSKNSSGVYRPKYKKIAPFSLVSLSPRTRSRPGYSTVRGVEPPPEDGARTKRFHRNVSVPRIPYWGRDEINTWPEKNKEWSQKSFFKYIYKYLKNERIYFSCEIDQKGCRSKLKERFEIKTQLCKLRVILRPPRFRVCIHER